MPTLQEYLNNLENKDQIKEINLEKINQERGTTELLEGGELDLSAFKNLIEVRIDNQYLATPLTKINRGGELKELIWKSEATVEDSEEDKKLWTELGIETDTDKQGIVREINRLAELFTVEKLKVYFATEKAPQEKLGDKDSLTEKTDSETNIYLNLERKDKQGNFCPSLVFWTLTQELSTIGGGEIGKNPSFWTNFEEQQLWVKDNLNEEYKKSFELLLNPSTFPIEKLEIKDLLTVYYPNAEDIADGQAKEIIISQNIVDQTWQTLRQEIMKLVQQELAKNPAEEELTKLGIKATVTTNSDKYSILFQYHKESPFVKELAELITATPLKLEVKFQEQITEELKKEKEQLPTSENFDKLTKEKKLLENYLQDYTSEGEFQEIKEKISKIG